MIKKVSLLLLVAFYVVTAQSQTNVSNALHFDGSNDQVQTTFPGVFGTTNRTFEAWIKTDIGAPSNMCILDYGQNAGGSRNTFKTTTSGRIQFISGGTNANITSNSSVLPSNQWTHVAFVLDNGTGYFFVNGTPAGSGNLSTVNTPTTGTDLRIGQRVPGGSIRFEGIIDEVRIWNVARTQAQLQNTMNMRLCAPVANLVAYYTFDQGVAGGTNSLVDTLYDYSGSLNHGTLSGFSQSGNVSNFVVGASTAGGVSNSLQPASACTSFTWTVNNQTYTQSGNYKDTILTVNQCDSIITLQLDITGNDTIVQTTSSCQSYTWPVNGQTYTQSGQYSVSFQSTLGCDSTHILNLSVNPNVSFSFSDTACDFYNWRGSVYTQTGAYSDTLTTPLGCDSVVTLNLVINNSISNTESDSACESYTWVLNGQTCTQTGTYTETGTTPEGCLITNTLNLTIYNGSTETFTESSCDSYYWSVTDSVYTETGLYSSLFIDANGCDSIIELDLTVNSVDTSVSIVLDTLVASQNSASYQWLKCTNGLLPVAGATNQSFSPPSSGSYAVEVNQASCVDTSSCVDIVLTGISNEITSMAELSFVPNPNKGELTLISKSSDAISQVSLLDLSGRVIVSWANVSSNQKLRFDVPTGMYLLKYTYHGQFGTKLISVE